VQIACFEIIIFSIVKYSLRQIPKSQYGQNRRQPLLNIIEMRLSVFMPPFFKGKVRTLIYALGISLFR